MSIEEAMMGGIVFKGKKEKPKGEAKVKTKKPTLPVSTIREPPK